MTLPTMMLVVLAALMVMLAELIALMVVWMVLRARTGKCVC